MTPFPPRITTRQTLLDFPFQCPYLAAITCTARAHSFQTPTRPTFFNMADFLPFSTNQKPENSRGVYANELAKILPNERTVLLTLKLVMLNTLTTGQRCQTLTFLDMSEKYMQRNGECFNFSLSDHLKQDRPGKVFGNVRLYKYPVKELCVYETLNYLKATENVRNSTRLLVSYIKP